VKYKRSNENSALPIGQRINQLYPKKVPEEGNKKQYFFGE
jgi:hypothetical protein